ncbi:hypothetical protein BT93_G0737 [Corymbia citriodora subsp. variegata]|nr:hypothetical protein BT93_G0737 [Corymbia citriodora subsp. variegata]KAF8020124.1 hypothetical protein BT93_G0737 [Corymbia citriodora subsp. variegata]
MQPYRTGTLLLYSRGQVTRGIVQHESILSKAVTLTRCLRLQQQRFDQISGPILGLMQLSIQLGDRVAAAGAWKQWIN